MKNGLAIIPALIGALGCGPAAADSPPTGGTDSTRPVTIVIVDRSTSRTPSEVAQDSLVLAAIIGKLCFGEILVIQKVHHAGRRDRARRWSTEMPPRKNGNNVTPVEQQSLQRARAAASLAAAVVFDSTRPNRTDLFSTLHDVAEFRDPTQSGRWRVVLLSDMLHSAKDLDMEAPGGIPGPRWIVEKKNRGLLPNLAGASVLVVGADRTTEKGADLFRFWAEYFKAAGTALAMENFRYAVVDAAALTADEACR